MLCWVPPPAIPPSIEGGTTGAGAARTAAQHVQFRYSLPIRAAKVNAPPSIKSTELMNTEPSTESSEY